MKQVVVIPGVKTAGTAIDLPSGFRFSQLSDAKLVTLSDGTAAGSVTTLSVVNTTPAAGQIRLTDVDTVVLGDATTDRNILVLTGVELGSYVRV